MCIVGLRSFAAQRKIAIHADFMHCSPRLQVRPPHLEFVQQTVACRNCSQNFSDVCMAISTVTAIYTMYIAGLQSLLAQS